MFKKGLANQAAREDIESRTAYKRAQVDPNQPVEEGKFYVAEIPNKEGSIALHVSSKGYVLEYREEGYYVDILDTLAPDEETKNEKSKLLQLSNISPQAAILDSWSQVEKEAFLAVQRLKPELAGKEINNWLLVIHTLLCAGGLDGDKFRQLNKLGSLRNQIAHNIDLPISHEGAKEYIESALILKRHLEKIA